MDEDFEMELYQDDLMDFRDKELDEDAAAGEFDFDDPDEDNEDPLEGFCYCHDAPVCPDVYASVYAAEQDPMGLDFVTLVVY